MIICTFFQFYNRTRLLHPLELKARLDKVRKMNDLNALRSKMKKKKTQKQPNSQIQKTDQRPGVNEDSKNELVSHQNSDPFVQQPQKKKDQAEQEDKRLEDGERGPQNVQKIKGKQPINDSTQKKVESEQQPGAKMSKLQMMREKMRLKKLEAAKTDKTETKNKVEEIVPLQNTNSKESSKQSAAVENQRTANELNLQKRNDDDQLENQVETASLIQKKLGQVVQDKQFKPPLVEARSQIAHQESSLQSRKRELQRVQEEGMIYETSYLNLLRLKEFLNEIMPPSQRNQGLSPERHSQQVSSPSQNLIAEIERFRENYRFFQENKTGRKRAHI